MKRKWSERSTDQKWASERCFYSYGSLQGIVTRLRQVANLDSVLPSESDRLTEMSNELSIICDCWISDVNKELSKLQFKARRS